MKIRFIYYGAGEFYKILCFLVGKRVELEKHMNRDGKEILVAVIITVFMPEFENLTDIRGRMHYFFTDTCQIDGPEECTGHQIK
ncbi:hypothetical protein [Hungatella sp.]|uniref:hypothetical protein n=1 Tax=Hungatella sp. TaxID=2613924 RepID=UPI002A816B60|nr:hypothetical protein [Hungatella sp.]